MRELSIGDVTYGIISNGGGCTYGIESYEKAFELAGRNAAAWVAERGGTEKVERREDEGGD